MKTSSLQDRSARRPTPESVKHQLDLSNQHDHSMQTARAFMAVVHQLQAEADKIKAVEEDPAKQGRLFNKRMKDNSIMQEFLDTYIGMEQDHPKAYSWRNSARNQARDFFFRGKSMRDALTVVVKQGIKGYKSIEMAKSQKPLREAIPSDFFQFLPENVVVEVDPAGTIQKVTDRFENEYETLDVKIQRMKWLVRNYNRIAKEVKADFRSSDEKVKLAALVTAIIMETGIRPGRAGSGKVTLKDGKEIFIETFGAVTLGPKHVNFIRDNFVELKFKGKKGGINTAMLSDGQVIKLLKQYVAQAKKKDAKHIFVTSYGEEFTYSDLQRYMREKFGGLPPTDFRKLKATEVVMNSLRERQGELHAKIRGFANLQKEELKKEIVAAVVEAIDSAIHDAQEALSHDKATTTRRAYINPAVVLRFLSTGRVEDTLEQAILGGKTSLRFDPEVFLKQALGKKAGVQVVGQHRQGSLKDLLDRLEDDLGSG